MGIQVRIPLNMTRIKLHIRIWEMQHAFIKGTYNTYFPKPNLRNKLHLDKIKRIVLTFHNHSVCHFS